MAAYHVVLVHFPIALWMTATLAILWRAVSDGPVALADRPRTRSAAGDRSRVRTVLGPGRPDGVAVGRDLDLADGPQSHAAGGLDDGLLGPDADRRAWCRAKRSGKGSGRWIMAALAMLGAGLLGITGTLGGHLAGIYTDLSKVLRTFGWEVHRTFYVPDTTLIILVAAAVLLLAIGWLSRKTGAKA